MAARKTDQPEVVTFKVAPSLVEAMKRIPNRSAFIRTAILNALENTCPLCQGLGVLTPGQKEHWQTFSADHKVEECQECRQLHLVCAKGGRRKGHRKESP